MMSMWLAYDRDGNVIATFDYAVRRDDDGNPISLVDFEAHEAQGGKMRDIKDVQRLDAPIPIGIAREVLGRDPLPREHVLLPPDHPFRVAHDRIVGSAHWPEWIGGRTREFRVELDAKRRAVALIHKTSGHRRERAQIEAAIAERRHYAFQNNLPAADIRDIVGGPDRPLHLDEHGRTAPRPKITRPNLPVIARRS